ncbi:hypothetical protein [Tritonibacter scottomollicae]
MMAERGVRVDHPTIYLRVQRYAPEMERRDALAVAAADAGSLAR